MLCREWRRTKCYNYKRVPQKPLHSKFYHFKETTRTESREWLEILIKRMFIFLADFPSHIANEN